MRTVSSILDRKGHVVETISPEATVLEAAKLMNQHRIGSLMVIADGQLEGIVTERDILQRIVAAERNPATTLVSEIMSTQVAFCHPYTTLAECRAVMTELRIRRLPVLDEGRLVGLVTIGDLTAQEIETHQHTIEYLNAYLEMPPVPHG